MQQSVGRTLCRLREMLKEDSTQVAVVGREGLYVGAGVRLKGGYTQNEGGTDGGHFTG